MMPINWNHLDLEVMRIASSTSAWSLKSCCDENPWVGLMFKSSQDPEPPASEESFSNLDLRSPSNTTFSSNSDPVIPSWFILRPGRQVSHARVSAFSTEEQVFQLAHYFALVFDRKESLCCDFQQRGTLSVANAHSQTILRICITFGHH